MGVDPISRRELWKMVQELLKEQISIIWSTAYLDEAERCHSVMLINEGKLLYHGAPQEFTQRVQGRVFKISNLKKQRRRALLQIVQQEEVVDGLVQGDDLRIIVKEKGAQPHLSERLGLSSYKEASIQPVQARFEDAFIDMLGGGPKQASQLAASNPFIKDAEKEMVVAKDLTKKFGAFTATDDISFTIAKGEIFGLLGPNGAGKSTTFKMLCGLLQPTSGHALVENLDLQKAPSAARARIGYMAQKFSLYGSLSVLQNLQFFAKIYNLKGKAEQEAVERMLQIFHLHPFKRTPAAELPLGFKQRLSLACANMHHPDVLFLDEPTSGVDPLTRREFWNHINGLVEKGVTVMVTTHFMDEAEYCDRIALIYRGKLIQMATPDQLKAQARSPENPSPTLEDAFIQSIEEYDARHPL